MPFRRERENGIDLQLKTGSIAIILSPRQRNDTNNTDGLPLFAFLHLKVSLCHYSLVSTYIFPINTFVPPAFCLPLTAHALVIAPATSFCLQAGSISGCFHFFKQPSKKPALATELVKQRTTHYSAHKRPSLFRSIDLDISLAPITAYVGMICSRDQVQRKSHTCTLPSLI